MNSKRIEENFTKKFAKFVKTCMNLKELKLKK